MTDGTLAPPELTGEQRRRIMDEVARYTVLRPLQSDEFTTRMFADRHEITMRTARNYLNEEVEVGRLERRPTIHDGHHCTAWRRVEDFQPQ